MRRRPIAPVFLLLLAQAAVAAEPVPGIRLNTLGFLPGAGKLALVPDGPGTVFEVVEATGGDAARVALRGELSRPLSWAPAGDTVRVADFSALRVGGSYRIQVPGQPLSNVFAIGPGVYRELDRAALKAFYFNRSGTALAARHAGAYARPAGHLDDRVLVHASAATARRPAGTVIASDKGWYDAGDYNKYIASSAISTYTLLAAWEHFPQVFGKLDVGIPESGDAVPDILDEAMWNLAWMLSMQDPEDGGVYHKLTNLRFDAMVQPHQAMREPRYVVAKSTSAALGFAATLATASRVLAHDEKRWPGLSARMLAAAERAWVWAQAHPAVVFKNPPDVLTGEYGDARLDDEFAWAAAELYITTGKDSYYLAMAPETVSATVPAWDDVRGLAWMSLAHHRARLSPLADQTLIASRIDGLAARLAGAWRSSGYRVAVRDGDFVWGSNAVVLNGAMMLLQAYRLNGKRDYLDAAQANLDYVLGRNAMGMSFVTGFGARSPQHPHHRPSIGDTVNAPVPGFVVGGPQPFQQDKAECPPYPSTLPALSYLDHACSYACNEVAINWNAPLVYVLGAISALTPATGTPTMTAQEFTREQLLHQEARLQFDSFGNDTAFDIGLKLIELARADGKAVAVEIRRNGMLLFAHGMDGTAPDHSDWIRRKSNLANRTGHSSYLTHADVKASGGDIDAMPTFDARDYAAHGGAFPVVVRGTGQVGTITVSGLPGAEDHALVVRALQVYLGLDRL